MNSTLLMNFRHVWFRRSINDGTMKQISVYDFYVLGKALEPLFQLKPESNANDAGWDAMAAHRQLVEAIQYGSILLPASREAAGALMAVLEGQFGNGIRIGLPRFVSHENPLETLGARAAEIEQAARDFDTVFKADMPRMTVFSAEQKGIYRTEDLIDNADHHFPDSVRQGLPKQAKLDIASAGKCLAFDVPTASAFHLWRALEIVIEAYFVSITGQTFESAKVQRNWGSYIKALTGAEADKKVLGNLDHIRSEYRNPVMHPNENVTADEAFSLFGIGVSAITQVMQEIKKQPHADQALI